MGNRVTVSISGEFFDSAINIYAHWGGGQLYPVVNDVLFVSRKGDGSRVCAQILSALFDRHGVYGVSVYSADIDGSGIEDNPTMFVDADKCRWRIGDGDWRDAQSTFGNEVLV